MALLDSQRSSLQPVIVDGARRVDDADSERHRDLAVLDDGVEAGRGPAGELGPQGGHARLAIGGVGEDRIDGEPQRRCVFAPCHGPDMCPEQIGQLYFEERVRV